MLKIGQNRGKIANYPSPMLNKDRPPCGPRPIIELNFGPVAPKGYRLLL